MSAVRVDFEVATDEDLRQQFVFADVNDLPLDLTPATFRLTISKAGTTVLEATSPDLIVVDEGGSLEIAIPADAKTMLMPGNVYDHALVKTEAGTDERVWYGTILIEAT